MILYEAVVQLVERRPSKSDACGFDSRLLLFISIFIEGCEGMSRALEELTAIEKGDLVR